MMAHVRASPPTEHLFSGTVGDAFVALCKLVSRPDLAPFRLRRMCRHRGAEATIARLVSLFPEVDFDPDLLQFDTIEEMRDYAFANCARYLNIFADGDGRGNEPDDPPGFTMMPHPSLSLMSDVAMPAPPVVGVHLHSGSPASGPRVLSTHTVAEFCNAMRNTDIRVVLFGTGNVYDAAELAVLDDELPGNVTNLVGRDTFEIWVAMLARLDLLIAPDGLAGFLALSQRVPTFVLFRTPDAILRMPVEWRHNAVCVQPELRLVDSRSRWMLPEAATLATAVMARLDPNALQSV
jgi:hypothetical protein